MKNIINSFLICCAIIFVGSFISCIHSPVPVSRPIDMNSDSITDATETSDIAFWKNFELQYYRDGENVYMEWGKIFADKSEDGRILVYSPDKNKVETRAYIFEDADLDPRDDYSMEALLGPALLNGWAYQESEYKKPDTIIVKAVAAGSDPAIYREPDYEAVGFFMNMFLVFFEVWIDLVLD